jgi:hypothetical protein
VINIKSGLATQSINKALDANKVEKRTNTRRKLEVSFIILNIIKIE